eukprot:gene10606-biopygen4791
MVVCNSSSTRSTHSCTLQSGHSPGGAAGGEGEEGKGQARRLPFTCIGGGVIVHLLPPILCQQSHSPCTPSRLDVDGTAAGSNAEQS